MHWDDRERRLDRRQTRRRAIGWLAGSGASALLAACGSGRGGVPPAGGGAPGAPGAPAPSPTAERKTRIVAPTTSWPRKVEAVNGPVTIPSPPARIHTLSVGYDEITFRLVDLARIVAVARLTVDPLYSNVAAEAAQVPHQVGRNAEEVLALNPDLVVASPSAQKALVDRLAEAGVTVVVTDLVSSVDGHEENIRLLAYLYGAEARGEQLIAEVRERLRRVDAVVGKTRPADRPRVLLLDTNNVVPGAGTLGDGIIRRAGGINAAAEAGVRRDEPLSLEALHSLRPDVLVFVELDPARPRVGPPVLAHPAVVDLPAVKAGRYYPIKWSSVSTLSHWNVGGVEALARLLYPREFA